MEKVPPQFVFTPRSRVRTKAAPAADRYRARPAPLLLPPALAYSRYTRTFVLVHFLSPLTPYYKLSFKHDTKPFPTEKKKLSTCRVTSILGLCDAVRALYNGDDPLGSQWDSILDGQIMLSTV
ncbi:hypothetical protein EVAR_74767_1 [Eumeta japonica]|uniref:Uncharacterized protein n=1 Tax=Eumeta variegata TaxID=151549 RepID=A0A4C1SRX3_EUMVA|nr:hypothetical protein EVAR_74767_1 [Eumeta japonica]